MAKSKQLKVAPLTNDPTMDLRKLAAACRVQFTWFGVRKTLSTEQKTQAAEPFGAEGDTLSVSKRLLDTKHPAFKGVSSCKSRAGAYWKAITLPYPEPGIRLLRQNNVEIFQDTMKEFKEELIAAVNVLEEHYQELKDSAQEKLGSLFNAADYPSTLKGLFTIEWDFPNIEPPEYLKNLSPELHAQEEARLEARLTVAVELAEQAFADEFKNLVSGLVEKLTGTEDGKKKKFHDSAIGNLGDFFDRFKIMSLRSNAELDKLIEQAKGLVKGVVPDALRTDDTLRAKIAQQLSEVSGTLEKIMVNQPRRKIIRGGGKKKVQED